MTTIDATPSQRGFAANQATLAALLTVGMAVTVGTALGFEHWGGFIPCALCLEQRTPYYIGIPVALAALVSAALRAPAIVTRGLFAIAAALMLYGAGLGVYHSGVEWGWWPGPAQCGGGSFTSTAGSLLDDLNAKQPPSCADAAGRFLGLSFAGWNVIASLALAAIALKGLFTRAR